MKRVTERGVKSDEGIRSELPARCDTFVVGGPRHGGLLDRMHRRGIRRAGRERWRRGTRPVRAQRLAGTGLVDRSGAPIEVPMPGPATGRTLDVTNFGANPDPDSHDDAAAIRAALDAAVPGDEVVLPAVRMICTPLTRTTSRRTSCCAAAWTCAARARRAQCC